MTFDVAGNKHITGGPELAVGGNNNFHRQMYWNF